MSVRVMASEHLVVFTTTIIFFFFSNGVAAFEPFNKEVEALVSIRAALNDPHGALANWDGDSVDPCSWAMITCSSENLVISLEASGQNFSGRLSGRIGDLKNIQQILLQNNNITGIIPPELGNLPNLQTLDLSGNGFSGEVPNSLDQLTSLRYLRLNNNSLSGFFPTFLSKIPHLSFLDMSFNNLTGPVPHFPTKTFNVMGNPMICGIHNSSEFCSRATAPISLPFIVDSIPAGRQKKHRKFVIAMATSLVSIVLLFLAVFLLIILWRKKQTQQFVLGINDDEEAMEMGLGNLRQFGLRELQSATENFSSKNILGKGGFGNVYRGQLYDGTVVAVKRLKDICSDGDTQFKTEVEMISLAVHRNLLRLVGYCATSTERLLVYPFMSNGSVASRLKGKTTLDWDMRKRIALGAGRGLLYLHEQCDPKIIHRDVKAANILLDDFCEAVVGDFGLAKLLDHGDSHVTTAVRGTVGHIAPEYLSTGQSSEKTDVFGFGILLLELVCGLRALEFGGGKGKPAHNGAMLDWVRRVHREKKLELVVDRDLRNDYDGIEVGEMVQVALLCTQYSPSHRPKMSEVVRMLEGGDGLAEKWEASNHPPPPTDLGRRNEHCWVKTMLNDDGEEDGRSWDGVEEMELSGPR